MSTKLILKNPEFETIQDICLCDHPVASRVAHCIADHAAVAVLTGAIERRCSVCDQPWGDVAYSEHERCAFLTEHAGRIYADCLLFIGDTQIIYKTA